MAGGLACIFFAAFQGDRLPSHSAEVGVTLLGSLLMISAHRLNHTFLQRLRLRKAIAISPNDPLVTS
jgi:hypothetical protein